MSRSEAEEKLELDRLVKILLKHITLHSIRNGRGVFNITNFEAIANDILEAGYLPVEPVQLEVLSDKAIINLAMVSRYYVGSKEEKAFIECVKNIIQATLAHNEAKGQLYRRKE